MRTRTAKGEKREMGGLTPGMVCHGAGKCLPGAPWQKGAQGRNVFAREGEAGIKFGHTEQKEAVSTEEHTKHHSLRQPPCFKQLLLSSNTRESQNARLEGTPGSPGATFLGGDGVGRSWPSSQASCPVEGTPLLTQSLHSSSAQEAAVHSWGEAVWQA